MSATVVWKFEIGPVVQMPRGAEVLSVGEQSGSIVAWALCDTDAEPVRRGIVVLATGEQMYPSRSTLVFVGTVQMASGLVFHVFDGGELA